MNRGSAVLFFGLLLFQGVAFADLYGASGGMKNESDVAVTVLLVRESGDYETQVVAAGAMLDFPENTARIKISASRQDPPGPLSHIRVAVIQPDGSRSELTSLESEAFMSRTGGKFTSPAPLDTRGNPL